MNINMNSNFVLPMMLDEVQVLHFVGFSQERVLVRKPSKEFVLMEARSNLKVDWESNNCAILNL